MKFLFLRSQLVDIEFGGRDGLSLGSIEIGFDGRWRNRRAWRWKGCQLRIGDARFGSRGAGRGKAGCRADRGRGRFKRNLADGFGDSFFERAAGAGRQSQSGETREDVEGGGKRSGSGLRAKHGREGVGGLAAGAGGDHVVDGLVEFVAGALDALKVV